QPERISEMVPSKSNRQTRALLADTPGRRRSTIAHYCGMIVRGEVSPGRNPRGPWGRCARRAVVLLQLGPLVRIPGHRGTQGARRILSTAHTEIAALAVPDAFSTQRTHSAGAVIGCPDEAEVQASARHFPVPDGAGIARYQR